MKKIVLNVGDIVSRPKKGVAGALVIHKYLRVFNGFMHNHPDTGVVFIPESEIDLSNIKEADVDRFTGTDEEKLELHRRAYALIDKQYHAYEYNCEHFVNEARHQTPFSSQVDNVEAKMPMSGALMGLGLGGLILLEKNVPKWLFWLLLGLALVLLFWHKPALKFVLGFWQSPPPKTVHFA